tara:strand:- start:860 stop:1552 length:693 start_codon:yes stop_codon:yes gene_type:complete
MKRRKTIKKCLETFHAKDKFYPIRMVMVSMRHCYICDEKREDTGSMYIKNYLRLHHYGYQFCKKCECLTDIFMDIYEESGKYIPTNKFNKNQLKNLNFWRVSSNKTIKPYMEKNAWLNINLFPIMSLNPLSEYKNNNLEATICWELNENDDYMHKTILLSNLIFYNRNIFKYSPNKGILNVCASYWKQSIEKAYNIANIPLYFITCVYKKPHVDNLILSKIIEYWKGDLI